MFTFDVTVRVQELCESRAGRPGLSVLTSLMVFRGRKAMLIEPYLGIGHSLSLICQPAAEDIELYIIIETEFTVHPDRSHPLFMFALRHCCFHSFIGLTLFTNFTDGADTVGRIGAISVYRYAEICRSALR